MPDRRRERDLAGLAAKYRALAALRARREEAEASGRSGFDPAEAAERAAAFRSLAREFPGVLREHELLDAATLGARARAVESALAGEEGGGGTPPRWMAVAADFHAFLREALATKRWLAANHPRGEPITEEALQAFRRWHGRLRFRRTPTREISAACLDQLRRPPGGRIQALVWSRLERLYGAPREALEAELFGSGGRGGAG